MRRALLQLTTLLLLAGVCVPSVFAAANVRPGDIHDGVVERVIDGDTVVLTTKERVRYIGVDTPELHHPTKPVQPYAREAKEFNRKLVEGKAIRLEFDVTRYDKFGRILAYVYLPDGTFVNGELIRQGYAQLLTIPPNVKYSEMLVKYQREARENKRGFWGE